MDSDINVVEMLRLKTEESDLNKYLKKTMGGYTRKSVIDYLNILRKQQQTTHETFSKNLETLYDEKNKLKKDNEDLLLRYNKLYAEYENLSGSLSDIRNDEDVSNENYNSIKKDLVILEEKIKKSDREKYELNRKIEQFISDNEELKAEQSITIQELIAQKEMLKAEKQESNKQRETVAELSCLLKAERDEVKYLKSKITDVAYEKLNLKVNELTEQISNQTEIIEKLNSDSILKENTFKTLKSELEALQKNLSNQIKINDDLYLQNNKLVLVNENLTYKLEEEYKKSIILIKEKSSIEIDKLVSESKLREAESYTTSLEIQLNASKSVN
jgi:chromosome segregation ATPase